MEHYVCPTCGGVADQPGVCKTEGCSNKGKALEYCDCPAPQEHGKGDEKSDDGSSSDGETSSGI